MNYYNYFEWLYLKQIIGGKDVSRKVRYGCQIIQVRDDSGWINVLVVKVVKSDWDFGFIMKIELKDFLMDWI